MRFYSWSRVLANTGPTYATCSHHCSCILLWPARRIHLAPLVACKCYCAPLLLSGNYFCGASNYGTSSGLKSLRAISCLRWCCCFSEFGDRCLQWHVDCLPCDRDFRQRNVVVTELAAFDWRSAKTWSRYSLIDMVHCPIQFRWVDYDIWALPSHDSFLLWTRNSNAFLRSLWQNEDQRSRYGDRLTAAIFGAR